MIQCKPAIQHLSRTAKPNARRRVHLICLNHWPEIEHIHKVLNIAYRATQRYQKPGINLADSYVIWLSAFIQLKKLLQDTSITEINICQMLHNQMERRFNDLNGPALQLAVFLDPRTRDLLTMEQVRAALCNLGNIWETIKNINKKREPSGSALTSQSSTSERECLDDYFASIGGEPQRSISVWEERSDNARRTRNYSKSKADIILELRSYERWPKEKFEPDQVNFLLGYWKAREAQHPEIFDMAKYVATIPPTQVSVERVFSIVKYVLTDQRTRLCPKILSSLIKIKLHREIAEKIMKDEASQLRLIN